jgi:hypothetical protein
MSKVIFPGLVKNRRRLSLTESHERYVSDTFRQRTRYISTRTKRLVADPFQYNHLRQIRLLPRLKSAPPDRNQTRSLGIILSIIDKFKLFNFLGRLSIIIRFPMLCLKITSISSSRACSVIYRQSGGQEHTFAEVLANLVLRTFARMGIARHVELSRDGLRRARRARVVRGMRCARLDGWRSSSARGIAEIRIQTAG